MKTLFRNLKKWVKALRPLPAILLTDFIFGTPLLVWTEVWAKNNTHPGEWGFLVILAVAAVFVGAKWILLFLFGILHLKEFPEKQWPERNFILWICTIVLLIFKHLPW